MGYKIILGPIMLGEQIYKDGEIISLSEKDAQPLLEKKIIEMTGEAPTTPTQEQELKALQQQAQSLQEQVNQKNIEIQQLQQQVQQKDASLVKLTTELEGSKGKK